MSDDIGLIDSRAKKYAKEMMGANYKSCTTREDDKNIYVDIEFYKADKTVDKTTLTFAKPKDGVGVVTGGKANQVLSKKSDTDFDTAWLDVSGGGNLEKWQTDVLEQLKPLLDDNIIYYRKGSKENPINGDRRDTGNGIGRNGDEVYEDGKWIKKIEVGSIGTDMITLRDGLNDIKVKDHDKTYNLVRRLKTTEGVQLGSSFSPLVLSANGSRQVAICYPNTNEAFDFKGCEVDTTPTPLGNYFDFVWDKGEAIVRSFVFKTTKESRIRLKLYYVEDKEISTDDAIKNISDDTLVYESMPDTEFFNPENAKCYGGVDIPMGESDTDLVNEMYLTNGMRYLLFFESCVDNYFLGNGTIPFFTIRYFEWKNAPLVNDETLEERLCQDITLDRGMWLLSKGESVSKEKAEDRNLIGIYDNDLVVGDQMEQTVIKSIGLPKVTVNGENFNIASELYVNENAVKKVFDGSELLPGQTGLLYQTIPKTYTMYDNPRVFPTYDLTGRTILAGINLEFMINTRSRRQPLFSDGNSNNTLLYIEAGERVILTTWFLKKLEDGAVEWTEIEIDTSKFGKPDEGYEYATTPYKPSRDRYEEELKKWRIECDIVGESQFFVRLTDPNGGEWTYTSKPKECSHIGEGISLKVGAFGKEYVKALNNVYVTLWDTLEENKTISNIDEIVKEIIPKQLVTKFRKSVYNIGSRDEMAIHKYPDLTKDFHTFFEPYASGVYRCFEMMENIPNGYFAGDNDFYAFVYAVSEAYKTVEILDIRSGRRFTKCMLAGKWNDWFEWGINQGGQVPKLVFANRFSSSGNPTELSLSNFSDNCTVDDVYWVTCGSRGQAIQVDNKDYLMNFAASFWIDKANAKLWYYQESQGMDTKNLAVYKFVQTPVTPPRGGCPYLTILDVIGDLSNSTNKGDVFGVDLKIKSTELHRNPIITIDTGGRWETTQIVFDGKERWTFEFPYQPNGNWKQGDTVTYTLSWQDQNGMLYNGFETIVKNIIV